jgi:hypothetical protein
MTVEVEDKAVLGRPNGAKQACALQSLSQIRHRICEHEHLANLSGAETGMSVACHRLTGLQFDEITVGVAEKNLTARRMVTETEEDTLGRKLVRNGIKIPDAQGDMPIVGKRWISRKIALHHYVQFLIANGEPRSIETESRALYFS